MYMEKLTDVIMNYEGRVEVMERQIKDLPEGTEMREHFERRIKTFNEIINDLKGVKED